MWLKRPTNFPKVVEEAIGILIIISLWHRIKKVFYLLYSVSMEKASKIVKNEKI